MTDLPPEVAEARRILHLVRPQPFSKARVYARLRNQRTVDARGATRVVITLFCLAATSSAMALGYHWVQRQAPALQPSARAVPSADAVPVPRKHNGSRPAIANQVADEEDPRSPADPSETTLSKPESLAGQGQPGTPMAAPAPKKAHSTQPSLRRANQTQESELSQQVRDYQQAVAPMRSNPQLALERLRAYRQNWRRSVIAEEVDLREIEALLALGRRGEAIGAARRFVQRYPSSARASDMQRVASEAVLGTGRFD